MSTRSTTWFVYGNEKKPYAIVYRHSDGYPEGAGVDILRFLDECGKLEDPRFGDPTYLAAKYVVFLADVFNNHYEPSATEAAKWPRNESKLDFLSVGVLREDPGDIEYRYVIDCKTRGTDGKPAVKCYAVSGKYIQVDGKYKDIPQSKWTLSETLIPAETKTSA